MEIHGDLNCHNSKAHKIALFILNFPLIWSATGMFWFPKGVNYVPPLVIAAFISSFFVFGFKGVLRHLKTNLFALLVFAISAYNIFQYQYHGSSSQELRAFITCFVFVVCFNRMVLKRKHIFALIFVASCGVLVTTGIQSFYFSISRAHGFINPIVFATYCASIAVMCFCIFLHLKNFKSGKLFFVLFLLLIISTLLTGSRGVWLALATSVVIISSFKFKRSMLSPKKTIAVLSLAILIFAIILYPLIIKRIQKTTFQLKQIKSGEMNNSIGARIQLWSSAIELAVISPVLGLGDSHSTELHNLYLKGAINKKVLQYTHYHNIFLDTLVKKGIIGLILLLALYIYPLIVSIRNTNSSWRKDISLGLFIIYLVSGLTDVPMNHDKTIYLYVFFILAVAFPIGQKNGLCLENSGIGS